MSDIKTETSTTESKGMRLPARGELFATELSSGSNYREDRTCCREEYGLSHRPRAV